MDEYKDIQDLLKPRRDIKASAELKKRVRNTVERKRRDSVRLKWIWGGISAGIAVAMLILVLIPGGASAMSSKDLLKATLNTLIGVDSFEMEVEIRTLPNDNFAYINPRCDFVTHNISVANMDSVLNWRVDKGSRKAVHGPRGTFLWIEALKSGWRSQNPKWDVLGYLSVFIHPTKTIEIELYQCLNDPTAEYDIKRDDDKIYLTIHSLPKGDFANPYVLNTSIAESECYRRYVIDADTDKLISASVSIMVDGREVEVIRLKEIKYGSMDNEIGLMPSDIEFIDIDSQVPANGLSGVNAGEAASLILNSFRNWNEDILGKVVDAQLLPVYKEAYEGAVVVDIGKAFKSGNDNNITYIPYAIKLRNGQIRQFNLSLMLTTDRSWIVAGGL